MTTRTQARHIVQSAQAAVDRIRVLGALDERQLRALHRVATILSSGMAASSLALESEALGALGRSADMAAQTLRALASELGTGAGAARIESRQLCRDWAARLLALYAETLGEVPAVTPEAA